MAGLIGGAAMTADLAKDACKRFNAQDGRNEAVEKVKTRVLDHQNACFAV